MYGHVQSKCLAKDEGGWLKPPGRSRKEKNVVVVVTGVWLQTPSLVRQRTSNTRISAMMVWKRHWKDNRHSKTHISQD